MFVFVCRAPKLLSYATKSICEIRENFLIRKTQHRESFLFETPLSLKIVLLLIFMNTAIDLDN